MFRPARVMLEHNAQLLNDVAVYALRKNIIPHTVPADTGNRIRHRIPFLLQAGVHSKLIKLLAPYKYKIALAKIFRFLTNTTEYINAIVHPKPKLVDPSLLSL